MVLSTEGVVLVTSPGTKSSYPRPPQSLKHSSVAVVRLNCITVGLSPSSREREPFKDAPVAAKYSTSRSHPENIPAPSLLPLRVSSSPAPPPIQHRAVTRQWQVHRVLRPEAYGGLLHFVINGPLEVPLPASIVNNTVGRATDSTNRPSS